MAQAITCPKCQRTYAVKPEYAGKRAKCKCGEKIQFPALMDELQEADVIEAAPARGQRQGRAETLEQPTDPYGLAEAAPPPRSVPERQEAMCVKCRAPLPAGAVLCVRCGTNQRTGQAVQTQVARSLPKAKPAAAARPVDDALTATDWLLILFCGPVAFGVALVRGFSG